MKLTPLTRTEHVKLQDGIRITTIGIDNPHQAEPWELAVHHAYHIARHPQLPYDIYRHRNLIA